MHSFTVRAVLAAFVLSTALSGAYAASTNTGAGRGVARGGGHEPSNGRESPVEDQFYTPGYSNDTYIAPAGPHRAAMTNPTPATTRHPHYHQRLAHVMGELGATNHRIAVDSRRGYLTASETARVRHEERTIRHAATRAADANGGVLPRKSYDRLQADIRSLNRQIHRYATA